MHRSSVERVEPLQGVQRTSAAASAAVAVLTTTVYVVVIVQEGNNPLRDVLPWVMVMLTGTLAAVAAAVAPSRDVGRFSAVAATVILGALGVVAIFSVGVGFVLAALLALFAAVWHSPAARTRPR